MNENAKNTVVIVEDEHIVGIMAKAMLETLGYVAIHCADGENAIETFKRKHEEVAFVLLDVVLPDMDGRTIYQVLRAVDPELKCIVSSGYAIDQPIQELLDAGANEFIHKPFRRAELEATINRLLGTGVPLK